MALKETFETFDGTGFSAYGTRWKFQTFTTTSAHSITDVALYGWKYGTPGDITVSIKAVDVDGKPTGADLCAVTVSSSVVSTLPTIGWYTFTFSFSYALSDATQYAIVVRTATGDTSNYYAPFGAASSAYAGGGSGTSTNSGSSWGAISTTSDMNFRIYGEPIIVINNVWMGSGGNFIVVTADDGVYLSTDFGANWVRKTPNAVEDTIWTKGICSSTGTYIIVVSSVSAIYRSANSGTAWAAITPAGGDTFSVNDLATSDDGQFMVIVGANSTTAAKSCYISTDYGATWTVKYPVAGDITYTECDISNDGAIIAVSTTANFYISLDSGATWLEQGMASSAEVWTGLSISGDGTSGIVANTNNNDEVFVGVKTNLYSEATWAESSLTSAGRAILDDADAAAQATTLGVGTADSPTWVGATLSGLTVSSLVAADASKALESVTVGTGLAYARPTLSLSHLGIEALTDPGADKIMFWDDSATACKWLGVGSSLAITTTTLNTIQDIRTSASPTFAGATIIQELNGEVRQNIQNTSTGVSAFSTLALKADTSRLFLSCLGPSYTTLPFYTNKALLYDSIDDDGIIISAQNPDGNISFCVGDNHTVVDEVFNVSSAGVNIVSGKIINASAGKVLVEDNDTSEPSGESDGYIGVSIIDGTARVYFTVSGTMYYVDGTVVAAAEIVTGNPIGLLLALTYNIP